MAWHIEHRIQFSLPAAAPTKPPHSGHTPSHNKHRLVTTSL
ncbi:MAG: hypothetical protein WD826_12135 [Actinomycetota bacterium]